MRRHRHLGMPPERMIGGQRLGRKHVDGGARELAGLQRGQQIGFDQVSAACRVDENGATRQRRKGRRVEYAPRIVRQRQQADQDLRAGQAFPDPTPFAAAKVAIFIASVTASLLGVAILCMRSNVPVPASEEH